VSLRQVRVPRSGMLNFRGIRHCVRIPADFGGNWNNYTVASVPTNGVGQITMQQVGSIDNTATNPNRSMDRNMTRAANAMASKIMRHGWA